MHPLQFDLFPKQRILNCVRGEKRRGMMMHSTMWPGQLRGTSQRDGEMAQGLRAVAILHPQGSLQSVPRDAAYSSGLCGHQTHAVCPYVQVGKTFIHISISDTQSQVWWQTHLILEDKAEGREADTQFSSTALAQYTVGFSSIPDTTEKASKQTIVSIEIVRMIFFHFSRFPIIVSITPFILQASQSIKQRSKVKAKEF